MVLTAVTPNARVVERVRRFAAFVAVSAGLHTALLLASDLDFGLRLGATPAQPVLHATLASAPAAATVTAAPSAEASASTLKPDAQRLASGDAAPSADKAVGEPTGGSSLPLPSRWYRATELGSLAQPLTLPLMQYPPELVHLGAVRLRIRLFIDEYGVVRRLEFVNADVDPAFKTATRTAWENVRFEPARREQVAVKSQKLLEIDFVP
jgi:hypothetical protein